MTIDTRWWTTRSEVSELLERGLNKQYFSYSGYLVAPAHLRELGLKNWSDFQSPDFRQLTRPQQVLLLVEEGLGEVYNGGINQLFSNRFYNIEEFRDAFIEFDWPELTARFVPLYDATYGNPPVAAQMRQKMMGVHSKLHGGDPKGAWDLAHSLYPDEEGRMFDRWFYSDWREYHRQLDRYVRANEDQLFRYD